MKRPNPNRKFARALASIVLSLMAAGPSVPILVALGAGLSLTPTAAANESHPRWKDFVTWLMEKKRTPQEDLILRHILTGGARFAWLDVYAHSMQEQTEALFRRWLEREGNPRRIPDLGSRADGNSRR